MAYYDVAALKAYIMQQAPKYGIDPTKAIEVWMHEGLSPNVWQSNIYKNGKREESYGPFQFYMGGGMGNDFKAATGLDPKDPKNVFAMADYALQTATKTGWSPWYGARDNGIGKWDGIGGKGPSVVPASTGPDLVSQPQPELPGGPQNAGLPFQPPIPSSGVTSAFVDAATGAPPAEGQTDPFTKLFQSLGIPVSEGKGILSHLKKPYYAPNASDAYLAQHLEDSTYPSLRSWLG